MRNKQFESFRPIFVADSQRGATLIAVLLILLLISVLGVMAMRQGLTSLNISTSAQVRQLLLQSADTPLNTYAIGDYTQKEAVALTTILGAALDDSNKAHEVVFCYRPTTNQPFNSTLFANVIHANPASGSAGNVSIVDDNQGGFCDLTTDFGSSRNAAVTQVAVTRPLNGGGAGCIGCGLLRATSTGAGTTFPAGYEIKPVRVISTSFLPAMATGVALATVQSDCLNGRISDNSDISNADKETVTDCLAKYGVPAVTQVQDFNLNSGLQQSKDIN